MTPVILVTYKSLQDTFAAVTRLNTLPIIAHLFINAIGLTPIRYKLDDGHYNISYIDA